MAGATIGALVEELQASGYVDRERVADRAALFNQGYGPPLGEIEGMAASIRTGDLADRARPSLGVIECGKAGCDGASG
jgi:hypothetical protein